MSACIFRQWFSVGITCEHFFYRISLLTFLYNCDNLIFLKKKSVGAKYVKWHKINCAWWLFSLYRTRCFYLITVFQASSSEQSSFIRYRLWWRKRKFATAARGGKKNSSCYWVWKWWIKEIKNTGHGPQCLFVKTLFLYWLTI